MKVTSLLCCENIAQDPLTQKLNILNPIQVIKLPNLPSNYSFSIYLGILDIDKEGKDTIRIAFFDKDDELLNDISSINLPVPKEADLTKPLGININLDFRNLLFSKEGLYYIKVFDLNKDGKVIGETCFEVVL